ncbi:hypothetical protein HDU98_005532 [Podochytrium sp. JEL0797]|nr:hypothetical protein HDU98_005532 [Podochytrium sp. JEL0797]
MPRKVALLTLTKDTRNHSLWNPSTNQVDDRTGELSKFAERFGDLSSLDDFAVAAAPVAPVKKAAPAPVAPAPPAGKKKK